VTVNAARALGQQSRHGVLEAGRSADFAVWTVESLAELVYWFGRPLCARVVRAGRTVYQSGESDIPHRWATSSSSINHE
jgi:imidazolonepropionase